MTAVEPSSGWTVLIPGFLLAGVGVGMINPPLASTAIGVVHHSRSGMASGINNTFRQVGIATGIAGLGAVFQHEVTRKTTAALAPAARDARCSAPRTASSRGALVSGEVSAARAATSRRRARRARARLPRRLHQRLHHDPADRRRDRARRGAAWRSRSCAAATSSPPGAPRARAQPARARRPTLADRLRRAVSAQRRAGDARSRHTRAPAGAGSADRRGRSRERRHSENIEPRVLRTSCWCDAGVAQARPRRRRRLGGSRRSTERRDMSGA